MTLLGILALLLIAAIAGAIGQSIAGYSLGGCLVSAAVGLIGALLGSWLAGALGLPEIFAIRIETWTFPVVWAIIGATIFSILVGLLTRTRPPRV
jgi:uncharacterized membrane protein YeaQ/YmgE (transglycosylase-associated protein family)